MSLAAPLAPAAAGTRARVSYAGAPIALALAAFALCAFAPAVLNDGDTWSHVATGESILDHRAVPHVDPFSFTFAGAPWTAHEWLSEVLLALAFRAAGWSGVMLLTGVAAGVAAFLLARKTVAEVAGPAGLALAMVSLALIAPTLLARPHILALPVLVLWCGALFDARERGEAPPIRFAALMTLWANLHGGFAFGLALVAPIAAEAVYHAPAGAKADAARAWSLFGLVSVVAASLTPFGGEGLVFPIKLVGAAQLAHIGEWRAEDFSHVGPLEIFLLALVGLALTRPLRLSALRLVLLVALIHLSLQHARHQMLLAALLPVLLARPIAAALAMRAQPAEFPKKIAAAALAGVLALAGARLLLPAPKIDIAAAPMRALAAVPADLRAKPVLNSYSFGGFLIFAGVRPFIDGRADMYGADFLALYQRLASGDDEALAATLKRYEIAWTMLAPDQATAYAMDRLPGWRRLYADGRAVVHVRENEELGLKGD